MLLTGLTFPDPARNSAETDPTPRTEGKKNPANAKRGEIKYQILHCCRDASSSDTVREIKYQILQMSLSLPIEMAPRTPDFVTFGRNSGFRLHVDLSNDHAEFLR